MRHGLLTEYDPKRGISISTLAYEYPRGFRVREHCHGSDQLIYAIGGVMEISAERSAWLIPPHFAIWIPALTTHSIRMPGAVSMRTLYLRRGLTAGLPSTCTVFHIKPLLRELIVEAVRVKQLRLQNRLHSALCDLLLSQLRTASPMLISVTMPNDSRALAVAAAVIRNPAERQLLKSMCNCAGVSVRTIERIFLREVGSDFETWRRQVRLMKAVELLVSGHSVKEVTFALGYLQPAAFVQMFKAVFATTPKAWINALQRLS